MDLLNVKVKHPLFGVGNVTEVEDNYVTVQFAAKLSKFIYPDAFEKFIKAEDATIQKTIMDTVAAARNVDEGRRQAEIDAHQAERDRLAAKKKSPLKVKKPTNIEDGFGADYNVEHLAKNAVLTCQQVKELFKIKITDAGRSIIKTPTAVVLISPVDKKKADYVYHDHFNRGSEYIFSGEGKIGDQTMSSGNKAIADAADEGKEIHLFVKFSSREYYYQGEFQLVEFTYEDDKDESGNVRKEYKYRLKKVV